MKKEAYGENPPPAKPSSTTFQQRKSIRQHPCEGAGHQSNTVQDGEHLVSFVPNIPARNQVDARRENAGLEGSDQDTTKGENTPVLGMTLRQRAYAQCKHQECQRLRNSELD